MVRQTGDSGSQSNYPAKQKSLAATRGKAFELDGANGVSAPRYILRSPGIRKSQGRGYPLVLMNMSDSLM